MINDKRYARALINVLFHTHMHPRTHARTHTHTHTQAHAHTHTSTRTQMKTHTNTCTSTLCCKSRQPRNQNRKTHKSQVSGFLLKKKIRKLYFSLGTTFTNDCAVKEVEAEYNNLSGARKLSRHRMSSNLVDKLMRFNY